VLKYKARLVAHGFQQVEGIDFYDTFALVVHWSNIHTIVALVALRKWNIRQLDVKIAFLNRTLDEEVYMLYLKASTLQNQLERSVDL
jgi:phosphopantetheine adenylyltransferase